MPSEAEYQRQQARIERELATRQIMRLERHLERGDLSPAAKELARQERDTLRQRIEAIDRELRPTEAKGLVATLFDAVALERLRRATADLAEARTELRMASQPVPSSRVQTSRKAAQRECAALAAILRQVSARFNRLGTGLVFLTQFKTVAIADGIRTAETELVKMADPSAWDVPANDAEPAEVR